VGYSIYKIGLEYPELIRSKTWETRILTFLHSSDDVYQIQQAKSSIASGGFFGLGPGNGIVKNHLPYAWADCIFAVICEEFGMIGGFIVISLYLWLLIRCINIMTKSPRAFGGILAMGLCLNIVVNAFANISVSVQLVPATGLTLPFISMGGTSLLFTAISFGIILSVSRHAEQAEIERVELMQIEKEKEKENESNH
jgi:cell division protein FtsW